ncbi:MAG: ASKHA domain-containing protein [Nitrospirota bacterium]
MRIRLLSGREFDISAGENLLQAFKRQGVYLVASCGGKGICSKCRVRIISGTWETLSRGKLNRQQVESGSVLACQTFAEGDLILDIPEESRLAVGDVIETARANNLVKLFQSRGGLISPLVQWITLDVPLPTLERNISDLDNLVNCAEEQGLKTLRFPHPVVSSLAVLLRETKGKISLGLCGNGEVFGLSPRPPEARYGLAVDVGTTTIVVYLVNLSNGDIADVGSTYNSQMRHGDDVITRIVYATENRGLDELREEVVNDINTLLMPLSETHSISAADIESAVVAGNTTMSHLFWGLNPAYIREEPYTPTLNTFPLWEAGSAKLSIHSQAPVYTLPCIASYVGGDIVAGVLASGMHRQEGISLFMDIGTNGEIVIGNNEWLVTAACSAGPCFEGSGIRHGMRATEGAVESVKIDRRTLEPLLAVIGNSNPLGICGSGMIDAISELFLCGLIDQKGRLIEESATGRIREGFEGPEFLVYRDSQREIVLTEIDIENILRAKAAIYAGISVLLKETGFSFDALEHVYIAGGFGNYLNVSSAITIGMLPDLAGEKFIFLGNTSIAGAYLCLLSETMRKEAEEIAKAMTNIELSVSREFMDEYLSALFLPHTDISQFPTVGKLLKKHRRF